MTKRTSTELKAELNKIGKKNVKAARKRYAEMREERTAEEIAHEAFIHVQTYQILGDADTKFAWAVIGLLATLEREEASEKGIEMPLPTRPNSRKKACVVEPKQMTAVVKDRVTQEIGRRNSRQRMSVAKPKKRSKQ